MRLCFIFIYGLSNKLRASVAQKGSGDSQHVPHDDPENCPPPPPPHPPTALASKLELTFLKLNESAVSGKWISNICLENILQKNEQKNAEKNEKDGGKTNSKDKIKICQRLPATPTAP